MPLNKASLGVSLNGGQAELIYLRRDWRGWHIVDQAAFPFPETSEDEGAFTQGVQKFLLKNGFRSQDTAVLGLPRRDVLFRHFTTPPVPEKDLPNLVSFEAERHLPGRRDEFAVGYQAGGRSRDGGYQVLLGAVKQSVLSRSLGVLRKANIVPRSVQPAGMGLAATFRNSVGADGPAVVVTVDNDSFTVDRLDDGKLIDSRQFALPAAAMRDGGALNVPEAAAAVAFRLKHPLFLETLPEKTLPPLWVESAPENATSLVDALERKLPGGPVSVFTAPAGSGRAFGLALLGLGVEKASLELSEEEAEGLVEAPRYRSTVALLLLLVAVAGAAFFIEVLQNYRTLGQIEDEVARLKEEKAAVEVLSRSVEERRGRLDFLRENVAGRTSQLELLRELTELIPEDTHLTDYNYRDGKLEISGLAPSASRLIPLLEASPYFMEAAFASAIVRQGQELERFKIRLKLEERTHG